MLEEGGPQSSELQQVGQRLKKWRKAHAWRARLPEELWAAAVALAGPEGIYRTARSLHLDYATLKRKVEEAARGKSATTRGKSAITARERAAAGTGLKRGTAPGESGTTPAAFVEMLAGSMAADCLIELEGCGRGRMRLQMKLSAPEVMSLVRFWRDGPA